MFKKSKLKEIVRLYNKIKNDFNLDKVYISDIFHPRSSDYFLDELVTISVYSGICNKIEFSWFDKGEECFKSTFIDDKTANDEMILGSIINALESVYSDYKVMNEEVIILLNKVGKNTLKMQILMDMLKQQRKNETN